MQAPPPTPSHWGIAKLAQLPSLNPGRRKGAGLGGYGGGQGVFSGAVPHAGAGERWTQLGLASIVSLPSATLRGKILGSGCLSSNPGFYALLLWLWLSSPELEKMSPAQGLLPRLHLPACSLEHT